MDRSDAADEVAENARRAAIATSVTMEVTLDEAQAWVDAYGRAWVAHDEEAGVDLFTATASFRETHFDRAAIGREAIRNYWRARVRPQQGNRFAGDVLVMRENVALVHWTADFLWRPLNMHFDLDAIARVALVRETDGRIRASMLEDWIERKLSEPAN